MRAVFRLDATRGKPLDRARHEVDLSSTLFRTAEAQIQAHLAYVVFAQSFQIPGRRGESFCADWVVGDHCTRSGGLQLDWRSNTVEHRRAG